MELPVADLGLKFPFVKSILPLESVTTTFSKIQLKHLFTTSVQGNLSAGFPALAGDFHHLLVFKRP